MAIKIGNKSEEGVYKLYKGIAALNVVAVNPNKAQLEKITGRTVDEEPVYLGKDDEGNDTVRVTIYAKTAPGAKVNNDIDLNVNFSFINIDVNYWICICRTNGCLHGWPWRYDGYQ